MGQYHKLINLDKNEAVVPHAVGDGLKLREWSKGGMLTVLQLLLSCAIKGGPRGGGDWDTEHPLVGSWAGDRIAIVGDYADEGDLAPEHHAESIYDRVGGSEEEDVASVTEFYVRGWDNLSRAENDARRDEEIEGVHQRYAEYREQGLPRYTDISEKVREMLMSLGFTFSGTGWLQRKDPWGDGGGRMSVPDMVVNIGGPEPPSRN